MEAAIDLADREGVEAVSMRRLAQELGVEAMSLYTHVRGKDDLLDGMADAVVARVVLPDAGSGWQPTLRATILAARGELLRHPWSARVIETRAAPGLATIGYMDRVAGILREGGFSHGPRAPLAPRAGEPGPGLQPGPLRRQVASPSRARPPRSRRSSPSAFPNVGAIAMAASHEGGLGGCDDDLEFAFGLDLVLEGLEARRAAAG